MTSFKDKNIIFQSNNNTGTASQSGSTEVNGEEGSLLNPSHIEESFPTRTTTSYVKKENQVTAVRTKVIEGAKWIGRLVTVQKINEIVAHPEVLKRFMEQVGGMFKQ